jgi:molybdopterin converting factor small subunit
MEEKKDFLGTFNTIVIILTSIVAAFTAYRTTTLSDKISNIKAVTEEGKTVSELIDKFSKDSIPNRAFDFAFLSLERYLKNTTDDGSLKPQDKEMLVGFAQSIIYDRIFNNKKKSNVAINQILIPKKFLQLNAKEVLKEIEIELSTKNNKIIIPTHVIKEKDSLYIFNPVSMPIDDIKAKAISLILKKVVFIQYSEKNNENEVTKIQNLLKKTGWLTPSIENVPGNFKNTIRYFHDEDRIYANELNQNLKKKYVLLRVYNFESKVPNGQLEVWLNNKQTSKTNE